MTCGSEAQYDLECFYHSVPIGSFELQFNLEMLCKYVESSNKNGSPQISGENQYFLYREQHLGRFDRFGL